MAGHASSPSHPMQPRRMLPREGLYIDPIATFVSKTVLNPILTGLSSIILRALLGHDSLDRLATIDQQNHILRVTKILTACGTIFWANKFLNWGSNNNWTRSDKWNPAAEIVLVTGGSGGIGASVTQRLAREGTRVVVVDILPLSFKPSPNITYFKCDLSDMEQIKSVMARIREEVGNPTALVNNAGLSRGYTIAEGSYYDNDLTFRINLLASFLITKEVLPSMISKNHGHIFSVASMSAFLPPASLADYSASKAALVAFNEALGMELKHCHNAPRVRNSVAVLSFTKTPLFDGETNQSQFFTPLLHMDTVGDAIVDTLYSGYSRTIFMPGIMRHIAWIRGAPDWVQHILRQSTNNLKVNFKGRQVIDETTGKLRQS